MLLVLSAPSGAGKSTLVKRLLAQRGGVAYRFARRSSAKW